MSPDKSNEWSPDSGSPGLVTLLVAHIAKNFLIAVTEIASFRALQGRVTVKLNELSRTWFRGYVAMHLMK